MQTANEKWANSKQREKKKNSKISAKTFLREKKEKSIGAVSGVRNGKKEKILQTSTDIFRLFQYWSLYTERARYYHRARNARSLGRVHAICPKLPFFVSLCTTISSNYLVAQLKSCGRQCNWTFVSPSLSSTLLFFPNAFAPFSHAASLFPLDWKETVIKAAKLGIMFLNSFSRSSRRIRRILFSAIQCKRRNGSFKRTSVWAFEAIFTPEERRKREKNSYRTSPT